jgi:hypothetical protein
MTTTMRVSSTDPALYLLDPHDLGHGLLPDHLERYRPHAERVVAWAQTYLCHPHPAVGREGPVCPFTHPSLDRALFWLTFHPDPAPAVDEVAAVVTRYRRWFVELEPLAGKDAQYKAILVLFPELAPGRAPDVIDAVQRALKPGFAAEGLMIGQFHAGCEEPGIWNPDFRPLRSPVPLLAIRHMVRTDAPFLLRDAGSLAAYLERFGDDVPSRLQPAVREAVFEHRLAYAIV